MLQVKSEITGRMSPCTIATGVELRDGLIGAIADIDLFDMFNIDMREATANINKREGTNYPLPEWDSMLWNVEKRGKVSKFNLDAAKRLDDNSRAARIARYAQMIEAGQELFPETDE